MKISDLDQKAFEAWFGACDPQVIRWSHAYAGWVAAIAHARAAGEAEPVAYLIEEPNGDKDLSFDDLMPADREAGYRSRPLVHPAPAQEPVAVPAGWKLVPESAIKWLFGEGPDENGDWFGDVTHAKGAFWWRHDFRRMLASPVSPPADSGDGKTKKVLERALEIACSAIAFSRRDAGTDRASETLYELGGACIPLSEAIREALASTPAPPADSGEVERRLSHEEEIEDLAKWLHDEGGFGDAWTDRTWPEHPGDDGRREGGYVKLVPSDVQALFRDVARRILDGRTLASTPAPPQAQDFAKGAEAKYTTGHCAEKKKAGGCQLHNLQCGYPDCDRRPTQPAGEG